MWEYLFLLDVSIAGLYCMPENQVCIWCFWETTGFGPTPFFLTSCAIQVLLTICAIQVLLTICARQVLLTWCVMQALLTLCAMQVLLTSCAMQVLLTSYAMQVLPTSYAMQVLLSSRVMQENWFLLDAFVAGLSSTQQIHFRPNFFEITSFCWFCSSSSCPTTLKNQFLLVTLMLQQNIQDTSRSYLCSAVRLRV